MTTWHASTDELLAYRRGSDNYVLAASVEAHLLACSVCRGALAEQGDIRSDTQRRWEDLTAKLESPAAARWSPLHRSGVVRPAVSTRPLLIAWGAAITLLLVLPLLPLLVGVAEGRTLLLAVAPLAPMMAVVLAYRQASDPAGELALATPMAGFRLIATRAVAVALTAAPVAVVVALLLDQPSYVTFGWLVPGLALATLVLVAPTIRVDPALTAAVLGAGWALAIVLPTVSRRATADAVAQAVASSDAQLLALAVATLALTLAVTRRDRITYRRTL